MIAALVGAAGTRSSTSTSMSPVTCAARCPYSPGGQHPRDRARPGRARPGDILALAA